MRLAFLCSSFSWGGLEINNLKLCSWLRDRGHEPVLLCSPQSRLGREAAQKNITVVEFDHRRKHVVLSPARRLARLLQQHHLRVLVIAHYRHFYLCVWAKLFTSAPVKLIYWQQMQIVLNRRDPYHAFFYQKLDAWIAPLHYLKTQLLKNTVLSADKIHIIPLGVDLSLFLGVSRMKTEARKTFGLPSDGFLVGTIGRIDKEKGQEYVLRAVRLLNNQGIPVKAVLTGEETMGGEGYLEVLHNLTKELGLEQSVYFRPFSKDVATAFACLDVFVMASLSEPIGMVTVEAMASGIAVIGTDSGGTPELLGEGKAGLLYSPRDANQLADRILQLFKNPGQRAAFIDQALKQTQLYSNARQCDLLESLVGSL